MIRPWPLVVVALFSCGEKNVPAPITTKSIGGDAVVRVGAVTIPVSLVSAIANTQHIPAREAALLVADDALAAAGALESGLDRDPVTRWALLSARARSTVTRMRKDALVAGAPTDAEVAELCALHWRDCDLPPQIRVVHAVALRPAKPDAPAEARAKALAAEIARAVAGATSEDDFLARAKAVPANDVKMEAQKVPAFVADGRISAPEGGGLDPTFVTAAFAITSPGATSPVVETVFGWHVIRLVEQLPGKSVSMEGRRTVFAEEANTMRGHKAVVAALDALRKAHTVEISTAAETLMGTVSQEIASPSRPPETP